ncbi:MAG: hypothetical protein GYA43_08010 [Bacteroidales bacterium]|nr:hypothetical protein [Bacteroidales bacterium]
MPFKNAGRLFITDAVIDGVAGNLVFDSGASEMVLNRTYFRNHARTATAGQKGITGNVGDVEKVHLGFVNLPGLELKGIDASLADLSHIENRRGVKITGLFGFELLKDYEVTIDAANNLMELNHKGSLSRDGKRGKPDVVLKAEMRKNIIFMRGEIGGSSLLFCLDSGAEMSVISSHCPKQVLRTFTVNRRVTLKGAGQSTTEVMHGKIDEIRFGSRSLSNFETIVAGLDDLSEVYGIKTDGMLGYNFLRETVISINFASGQVSLWFNKNHQ